MPNISTAELTSRIEGFTAVAVEADWPDAYRVNRFVRGIGEDMESVDALVGFKRFPTLAFIGAKTRHRMRIPCKSSEIDTKPGEL
jgi:hypothetical protein